MIKEFKRSIEKLNKALNKVTEEDLKEKEEDITDFKQKKRSYIVSDIKTAIKELKKYSLAMREESLPLLLTELDKNYGGKNIEGMKKTINKIADIALDLKEIEKKIMKLNVKLPLEIKEEVNADFNETQRCFENECYRSATILCGRILETSLYRKYYDVTGQDILETNPGMGLGKLIAKLKEKNINFAPGTTQQIHLINQARIHSVHKKAEVFKPTEDQTHAIILFTVDILRKLFMNKKE